jgi:cell cycle serine/threonine-protein kinase CDC5/MSD2
MLGLGEVPQSVTSAGFDAFSATLVHAFTFKAAGKLFHDPQLDVINPLPQEKVFIVSWVDHCNKYGMGHALTDGTMGVYFEHFERLSKQPKQLKAFQPFC